MALRELAAFFGIKFNTEGGKEAQATIGGLLGGVKELGAALVGGAIVRGFSHFILDTVEQADNLGDLSDKIGIAAGTLQTYGLAAEIAGASQETMTTTLKILAKNLNEAKTAGGEAAKSFKDIGVDVKGNASLTDVFLKAGGAIGSMTDETKRAATAQKVFGRGGLELLGLFKDGEEGARNMLKEIEALGGGFSGDLFEAADKADKEIRFFGFALKGIRSQIVLAVLPAFTATVTKLVDWIGKIQNLIGNTNILKAAFILLGLLAAKTAVTILSKYSKILLQFGKWALIFVVIAAVVDDLITLFEGGDSVIGAFLDTMFGVGTARDLVKELKGIWEDFTNNVLPAAGQAAKDLVKTITGAFATAWAWFSDQFKWFGDQWIAIFDSLPAPVQAALDSVKKMFEDAVNWIVEKAADLNPFKGLLDDLVKVGNDKADAAARAARRAADAGTAPGVPKGRSGAGAPAPVNGPVSVTQETHVAITAPPGANARELADLATKGTRNALKDHGNATAAALVQTPG